MTPHVYHRQNKPQSPLILIQISISTGLEHLLKQLDLLREANSKLDFFDLQEAKAERELP
jgi:hypothetical protein